MKWKSEANKIAEMFKWHEWFAWYPVILDDTAEWVWLEKIMRKKNYVTGFPIASWWEYRQLIKETQTCHRN